MSRIAVYTGSFDPITLGHLNVIDRSRRLFERLIVGIGVNADKNPLFAPEERAEFVRQTTRHFNNVEVQIFSGLAVEFVKRAGAKVMVRGVRPLTDIAAEFTMAMANRQLESSIETVFLMADAEFAHVSSSLIKQVAALGSERDLSRFLPPEVIPPLRERLSSGEIPLTPAPKSIRDETSLAKARLRE